MNASRPTASTLRIVVIALLCYTVGLIAYLALTGAGGAEIGAMGAFLLAMLAFVVVVSALGLHPVDPKTRAPRRLMLTIAAMAAGGIAILALFSSARDALLISVPMLAFCVALHFYDKRTAFPMGGTP